MLSFAHGGGTEPDENAVSIYIPVPPSSSAASRQSRNPPMCAAMTGAPPKRGSIFLSICGVQ